MLNFAFSLPVYLCCEPIDMRNNFDGLCAIITSYFKKDPLRDGLFVFVNKPGDKMKILFWDRHGYWLLYKRLEAGRFQMPSSDTNATTPEALRITYEQLMLIIEGIDLASVKRRKRYSAPVINNLTPAV
jgi:transposase